MDSSEPVWVHEARFTQKFFQLFLKQQSTERAYTRCTRMKAHMKTWGGGNTSRLGKRKLLRNWSTKPKFVLLSEIRNCPPLVEVALPCLENPGTGLELGRPQSSSLVLTHKHLPRWLGFLALTNLAMHPCRNSTGPPYQGKMHVEPFTTQMATTAPPPNPRRPQHKARLWRYKGLPRCDQPGEGREVYTVRESSGSKQVHTLLPCCLLF